ncbi:SURF1 family cytochrome oxidase biogenesis protein [Thermaurantiacus tibetensis]|uniref:SURF1 family cytochrome oxidase biogenesis protein n=1 Tax=Thermaurantiacus tibetensis TaxID=2759035 RepID=UPI00188F9999|nr:SURF1 family cytochrome oxidase biogenesis protein [Thermaurantiacus tibetensis]
MTAAALPLLVALGVWQLQRAEWKEGLLAELRANAALPVAALGPGDELERVQFRRVRLVLGCDPPPPTVKAGRNAAGRAGYVALVRCTREGAASRGDGLLLAIGWGERPDSWKAVRAWPPRDPRPVEGVLVGRDGSPAWMLVASTGAAPLEAAAPPALESIPNNHRAYAAQWFGFAAILAAIYGAYVVRWRRGG